MYLQFYVTLLGLIQIGEYGLLLRLLPYLLLSHNNPCIVLVSNFNYQTTISCRHLYCL